MQDFLKANVGYNDLVDSSKFNLSFDRLIGENCIIDGLDISNTGTKAQLTKGTCVVGGAFIDITKDSEINLIGEGDMCLVVEYIHKDSLTTLKCVTEKVYNEKKDIMALLISYTKTGDKIELKTPPKKLIQLGPTIQEDKAPDIKVVNYPYPLELRQKGVIYLVIHEHKFINAITIDPDLAIEKVGEVKDIEVKE